MSRQVRASPRRRIHFVDPASDAGRRDVTVGLITSSRGPLRSATDQRGGQGAYPRGHLIGESPPETGAVGSGISPNGEGPTGGGTD
jgi:hypothetical protein